MPDELPDGATTSSQITMLSRPAARAGSARRTLLDIFAATVAEHAGRIALDTPASTLTYGELDAQVRTVADRLRAHGIGVGDRIGVYVPSGTTELYIAILGILHAGAAYVPVDADDAPARARSIFAEAGACAALVAGLELDLLGEPSGTARTPSAGDDAWIIFTSGSSGKPKGVAVSHGAAAAFVDAETRLWTVTPEDRVLAGLSVSFDASCEEMWLAWRHGAALVPVSRARMRAAGDLGPWLREESVSVISTVPTLASMWSEEDLAGIRLMILGGEACPEPLAWRLSETREVWNTYGPTETTVVSTAMRLLPGRPVLIGWPLDGWEIAIVDEQGEPVALGESGELVIAGVGLGRYLDDDLDARRYAALPSLGWTRAYRTGDMVRETIDGLVFLGRRDDQIKLGGRRLELGEVDAHLQAVPGVAAAAAAVKQTESGNPLLVGYVVGDVDPEHVRAALAEHLPNGVAPLIMSLPELPTTSSGKADRKALPWPPPAHSHHSAELEGTAAWLAGLWEAELGPYPVDLHSDFFELGGSSLAAAKLATRLRETHPAFAVTDIYTHRRLGELASHLDRLTTPAAGEPGELARPAGWFGAAQLVGVVLLLALNGVQVFLGTLAYANLAGSTGLPHVGWGWLIGAWVVLASTPGRTLLFVLARRLLLGSLRPGRYPRHSWLALRLWFVERLSSVTHVERLAGTPWVDRYARLLGADVGAGARLATLPPATGLVHIGAGVTVEPMVDMQGWWIDGAELVIDEIHIGERARIGTRTLLEPGTRIGAGAEIEPGSVVTGEVPDGEHWGGVPACHCGPAGASWPSEPPAAPRHRRAGRALFALSLPLEALLSVAAVAPAVAVLALLRAPALTPRIAPGALLGEAAAMVAISVPLFAVLVALALRFVWKLVRPGWVTDDSPVAWALWFGGHVKDFAGDVLFPVFASLFTAPWLRLMGIEVGQGAEMSTSTGLNPLVSIGELSQATDDIGFSGVRARGGALQLERISVGKRSFLGPGSILRGGTRLGDDSLLGVMTLSPACPPHGTSWFGVPALELPRVREAGEEARTTNPPRRLIAARAVMDVLRILGPNTLALLIGFGEVLGFELAGRAAGIPGMVLVLPIVVLGAGLLATTLTVVLKWALIGRYRRDEHPLWSFFVWRDELVNTAQEQLACASLIEVALGTPVMALYLRAMGARIGRGTWIDTSAVTEFDMIDLADGAVVNRGSCLMTHLFHDRRLRIGPTRLGCGATLGPTAVVLPDTELGEGTTLCGHSVALRGERLPAWTRWRGAPVARI